VLKIMEKFDHDCSKGYNKDVLTSTPNNHYYEIMSQAYGAGKFLEAPIQALAATSLLEKIYTENLGFDLIFMETGLSVVRAHTKNNLINFFEIGTGTGGFFKKISSFLHPRDALVCSDINDTLRFVHNEVTLNLPFEYHYYNLNEPFSSGVQTVLNTTDVIIAHNALHVADTMNDTLQGLMAHLQPGGFMMLYECTSPFYLTSFGLDKETWNFTDERSYGLWMSVEEWIPLFARNSLDLVSFSTNEIATIFLVRKRFEEPAINYIETPITTFEQLPPVPTSPTLYVAPKGSGIHSFVRSIIREGFDAISLECLDNVQPSEASIALAKALRLQTYVVTICGRLATHSHVSLPTKVRQINATVPAHVEFLTPGDLTSGVMVQTAPRHHSQPVFKIAYSALNLLGVMLASNKINKDSYLGFSKKGSGGGLEFSGTDSKNRRVMGALQIGGHRKRPNHL
jgi:SAM-dependent methyltransferase